MKTTSITLAAFAALSTTPTVLGGIISYGLCQTGTSAFTSFCPTEKSDLTWPFHSVNAGCNTVAVACYSAAGFTFGTIAAPVAPAAILACNTALGTCLSTCAAVTLLAPIP